MNSLGGIPVRWLQELNVAIPLFVMGWFTVAQWITTQWARLRGVDVDAPDRFGPTVDSVGILGLVILIVALAVLVGLSPRSLNPARAWLTHSGHAVLALVNLAVFATIVLPFAIANLTGFKAIGHLMWIGIPVLALAGMIWPFALVMVWAGWGRAGTTGVVQ